jgi:hypothetical protein
MKWRFDQRSLKVLGCSYNCDKHEHFEGTYEQALKYFLGTANQKTVPNVEDKLYNIVLYHQLSYNTIMKTSAELYDILMKACSLRKYWVEDINRHNVIMNVLDKAKENYLIKDDEILKRSNNPDCPEKIKKRAYKQAQWEKSLSFK